MDDVQKKMDNALVHFEKELNTLRTSRQAQICWIMSQLMLMVLKLRSTN